MIQVLNRSMIPSFLLFFFLLLELKFVYLGLIYIQICILYINITVMTVNNCYLYGSFNELTILKYLILENALRDNKKKFTFVMYTQFLRQNLYISVYLVDMGTLF